MQFEWGHDGPVTDFAAQGGGVQGFGECQTLAAIKDGTICGGFVFHDWNESAGTIEISGVVTDSRAASRRMINIALAYAFSVARLVICRTDERNHRVRRLCKACGADEYLIPQLRGQDIAEAVLTLTEAQWAASKLRRL